MHDHTSVLRFIETKFNLGALTRRDANADSLLDCLDFHRPAFLEPPTLAAPGLPATGSACQPQTSPPPTVATPAAKTTAFVTPGTATGRSGAVCPVPPPMTDSQDERVKLLERVRGAGLSPV